MKPIWRILLVGLIAVAVPTLTPIPASAAVFTVNSPADPGDGVCNVAECTLREAILAAESTPAVADTIVFDIPGPSNPVVIDVETSELPTIDWPLTIDGLSDPDSARVELHDSDANAGSADGLSIGGSEVTIIGMVIRNFGNDGINITAGASGNRIENSFIGTDGTGTLDQGNGGHGINVQGAANILGSGNVISSNGQNGINITGSGASANIVKGNLIGTDASGTAALGNSSQGVVVTTTANNNLIGGTTAAERNVISGNGQDGVRVQGAATANTISGNFIGTDAAGSAALPNAADGVGLRTSASTNTVGGSTPGTGNIISGNSDDGVQVGQVGETATIGNAILGNSISGNGNATAPHNELGIDLVVTNGVDANDLGDPDTGPNNLQNFPVVTSAASNASTTTVGGTLNSEASKTYRLEFFSNSACDPSGNGEGQTFLGSTSATTDGSGNANFPASLPTPSTVGHVVTATATDPNNNTSEFSACSTVVFDPTPPATPDTTPPTTPTTNAGAKFQKQRTFPVTWSTSTDPTGPVRYDVRYREAPYNGGFGGFVNWQTTTTATSATFTGSPGTTYCFSARAIDGAGNASAYGAEDCTALPVNNTSFKHRGKWAKKTGSSYYLNTFSRTKQQGAALTLPGVQAKALSIIVTKCRACGVIHVFFKGKMIRKINLRSKAAGRQKLRFINLRTFGSVQTGTLRVRVASRGKLVIVEGLGVSAA